MRGAGEVLRRARALVAVAERGLIEAGMRDDAAGALRALRDHVALEDLRIALDDTELGLLETPHGALDRAHIERATGHLEGAAVLCWALSLAPLPRHDEPASSYELTDALTATATAALRPGDELLRAAHRLHAIADRLQRSWPVDFVRLSQEQGFDLFGIAIVERDLAVAGLPVSRADPDHVRIAAAIAAERLRAVTWLLLG
jgi:hypothetical protein